MKQITIRLLFAVFAFAASAVGQGTTNPAPDDIMYACPENSFQRRERA
jgi:hypothetical protein